MASTTSGQGGETERFIQKLKQKFNEGGTLYSASEIPQGKSKHLHGRNISISTTDDFMQPLMPSSVKAQPYSTRNRSLQHGSLRPESITAALMGGIAAHKRSRDQLTMLNEQVENRKAIDPFCQKATKLAYKSKLKPKLMNTSQAANVYYGPAANKPLLGGRSRGLKQKRLPSIPAESFAKIPSNKQFSQHRKDLSSKMSEVSHELQNISFLKKHSGPNQMFSLTHYPNDSSKKQQWVDPQVVADHQSLIDENVEKIPLEPGLMFDELNQTSPSLKHSHHKPKITKQMGSLGDVSQKMNTTTSIGFNQLSNQQSMMDQSSVTGVNFYKEALAAQKKQRNRTQARRNEKNGTVLLLSNYKPKDFGNAKIDLTIDGGQHLRSPGESPPKITKKNVEQIFKDPVFNHKKLIQKLEPTNRHKVIGNVTNSLNQIEQKLTDPRNYKQFFWTPDMNVFGFGTVVQIKATTDALQSDPPKNLIFR